MKNRDFLFRGILFLASVSALGFMVFGCAHKRADDWTMIEADHLTGKLWNWDSLERKDIEAAIVPTRLQDQDKWRARLGKWIERHWHDGKL